MRYVTCNGCFDGLHPGHLFFLGYCLAQGDRLIVGLNSDDYIKKHKREDPNRTEHERIDDLMNLGFIYMAVVFREDTPIQFIRNTKPDVHCNGEEYGEDCVEAKICAEIGAKLVLVPRIGGWSTKNGSKIF